MLLAATSHLEKPASGAIQQMRSIVDLKTLRLNIIGLDVVSSDMVEALTEAPCGCQDRVPIRYALIRNSISSDRRSEKFSGRW
jgi:hypothetical protein